MLMRGPTGYLHVAEEWASPDWLTPYAPHYFPAGERSWYAKNDLYADALNCVAQTCARNYWQDPDAVSETACVREFALAA